MFKTKDSGRVLEGRLERVYVVGCPDKSLGARGNELQLSESVGRPKLIAVASA